MGMIGILLAKFLKIPLVGTYHTLVSETLIYASPVELFKQLGIRIPTKKNVKSNKVDNYFKKITWQTVNKIYGNCDLVIAPSLPIKNLLIKQGLKKNIHVLSSGIDFKLFFPNSYTKKSKFTILHVGRIGYEKNIDVIIKSFKLVVDRIPEARLVLAGDGPALDDIKKTAIKLDIVNKITFLGYVERSKLPDLYRNSNIFVTASTMETLGLVVLESMACGLPVVAVNKYALPWLVKNNINGFITKPFSQIEMSQAIIKILENTRLASKFGKEAFKRARQQEIGKVITKLESLYVHIIKK